jgi:hypothetical protein
MRRTVVAIIVVVAMAGAGVGSGVETSRAVPKAAVPVPSASPGPPDAVTGVVETWGFEADEGFGPGFVGGQVGWSSFAGSTNEAHIDTANPHSGTQHVRISWDPAASAAWTGAWSPRVPDLVADVSSVSVWVAIGATGGWAYEVGLMDVSPWSTTAGVRFEPGGGISVLATGTGYVGTGAGWIPDAYVQLEIDVDPIGNTIRYFYGGNQIFATAMLDGTGIDMVGFARDNRQSGEHGDFDDLVIDRGSVAATRHHWSFTGDASDPVGGAHASLYNGASVIGGALVFDGVNAFAILPIADTLDDLTDVSVEMWATWRGWESWERFFDFGTGTTVNWFMTPSAGDTGRPRVAITTGGNPGEQRTDSDVPFPRHELTHVVFTLDGDGAAEQAKLYMNGSLVGSSQFSSPLDPAELGPLTDLWLGRSQYYVDPYFDGSIDELVIYDGVLSQAEVVEHYRTFVFADGFEWGGTDRWSAASP